MAFESSNMGLHSSEASSAEVVVWKKCMTSATCSDHMVLANDPRIPTDAQSAGGRAGGWAGVSDSIQTLAGLPTLKVKVGGGGTPPLCAKVKRGGGYPPPPPPPPPA